MTGEKTNLEKRIESGRPVLLVEVAPPQQVDPEAVRARARRYAGKVDALGVSDNRDDVCMSALAAASLIAAEQVEPLLHIVTRDRNRIALASECLGAHALGVRNLLCTTGTHQTLGRCGQARNVFDVDSVQLLQMYREMGTNGNSQSCAFCLGAVASPYADPIELQVMKLAKKAEAGAKFLITQPVFDIDRFKTWWSEVTRRGLHKKLAILAGIKLLTEADSAGAFSRQRPQPMIPDALLERLSSRKDKAAQQTAGLEIAFETIRELSALDGLRGFEIRSDGDDNAVFKLIDQAGLRCD